MGTVIDLSAIELLDGDGRTVRLGDIIDRPTVIDLVRYYGCAPCRAQLVMLSDRFTEVQDLGANAMGIGPAAAYQARLLLDRHDIPFPLLLDPHHHVATAVGLHRQSLLRFVFDVRAWWRWLRAFLGQGQGKITGAYWETPGILIVDAAARVRWAYRGRSIGDYPPFDVVMDELRTVTGEPDAGR